MKNRLTQLLKALPLLILMVVCLHVNAQQPNSPAASSDFSYTIANAVQTDNKTLEFDLYLLDTDAANSFELASVQAGVLVNSAIYNGGTLSVAIVAGTSDLSAAQQPSGPAFTQTQNCIKVAPKSPPGAGNGTIIATTGQGSRICRLRLTNTVAFAMATANLTFNFTTSPYPTKVFQYISGVNTGITCSATNCTTTAINFVLNGPPTAYNLNAPAGVNYCQGGTGLTLTLQNSQTGVNYQLYKNAGAYGVVVAGSTGNPLSWTNLLAGTYTVVGTSTLSLVSLQMTGTQVIVEDLPSVGGSVGGSTTITIGSSTGSMALSGNTGTVTKWQKQFNGGGYTDIPASAGLTSYSEIPAATGTYNYQAVVTSGTCTSALSTPSTIIVVGAGPILPTVVTNDATGITATGATLNGTVSAGNDNTATSFEWGLTTSYGTPVSSGPLTGNSPTGVSAPISGLTSGLTYHFRCVATNSAGTTYGLDKSFVASSCPLPDNASAITGPANVCATGTGYVFTVPSILNATTYNWTFPTGFTITSGGTTNSVTVTATGAAVSGNVSVYGSSVCGQGAAATKAITVNPLPVPTITGSASVCINSTANVYTTQVGMSNYVWTVSAGGTITAGGTPTSNTVTVNWTTAGAKTVTVSYTNPVTGCSAASPFVFNVTVNPLPVPTITGGTASVCQGASGIIYTTEAGMTGYAWTITGGTITAGGTNTSNTATVTWNTVGAQTISVNYVNGNGCTAVLPTIKTVTVNALPVPGLLGQNSACLGAAGNVYTTDPGMTAYVWTVSSGGTITAGGTGTSNTVTVTWTTAGTKTVSVNYANANGCTASTATVKTITVNPLPVPTVAGPNTACVGVAGNVYTTEAAMSGYVWTVTGGTITAGGTATSNTVTITWTSTGAKTVCVNYTNANGCTAAAAVCYTVNVSAVTQPTIAGSTSLCINSGFYNYTTEAGMTNYVWTINNGGTITFGQGTNVAQVSWTAAGPHTISVNYTSGGGCPAPSPTSLPVTVNPLPGAAGTITGTATVCGGTTGVAYSMPVVTNATSYVWNLPAGATIATGLGTNSITVNFAPNASSGNIVAYGNNVCGNGGPSSNFALTVNPLPAPAGNITGSTSVCEGTNGVVYSIATIPGATSYAWTVPAGVTIVSGSNTNSITVNFTASAVSGTIAVHAANTCGAGGPSNPFTVTVNPIPATPTITASGFVLSSSAATGNKWYKDGVAITGATGQTYTATHTGWYWTVVTTNDCSSGESNHIYIVFDGINTLQGANFELYPVPNDGKFNITITSPTAEKFNIVVYNSIGAPIFEEKNVEVNGRLDKVVDLRPIPNGVYTVVFKNSNNQVVRKIVVNK